MQKNIRLILLSLAILLVSTLNDSVRAEPKSPDSEKRSSIHLVDGFAYLSEDKTLSQIRSEAFALAKRQALESAQTHIQSKTKVEDFVLTYDLIWSEADGSVRVLEQKDHGVVENSRYHVWIKAEVFYGLVHKTTGDTTADTSSRTQTLLDDGAAPLTVKVWTDKKRYIHGEEIVLYIRGNRDFYGVVVDVMANGDIIQLLPNEHRSDNAFKAGVKYRIPGDQDQFSLAVSPPYGRDNIVVYASDARMDSLPTQAIGGGLGVFNGTQNDLAVSARGIRITTQDKHQPNAAAEFYEARWSFSTAEK